MRADNIPVLSAQNVSKKYCRSLKRSFLYGAYDIAHELTGTNSMSLRPYEFWAVRDVSFTLQRGQSLGLIGVNGSGKTSLLKILSGVIKPTAGNVRIRGRVAPLLALGAGFNPVLSGRENIYINLALLGMSRKQIALRVDEIIDFAEVWEAIDAPLRTYSSGMAARLGFSCAIHTEPDLLFVDEVLAVGDSRFRTKCYQKLSALRANGTALILVSHSHNAILSACDHALFLDRGRQIFLGPSDEALRQYDLEMQNLNGSNSSSGNDLQQFGGRADFAIRDIFFEDETGKRSESISVGRRATLCISFFGDRPIHKLTALVIIRERSSKVADYLSVHSGLDGQTFKFDGGQGEIRLTFPECGLKPGQFLAKISLIAGDQYHVLDMVDGFSFECRSKSFIGASIYYQSREWLYRTENLPPRS